MTFQVRNIQQACHSPLILISNSIIRALNSNNTFSVPILQSAVIYSETSLYLFLPRSMKPQSELNVPLVRSVLDSDEGSIKVQFKLKSIHSLIKKYTSTPHPPIDLPISTLTFFSLFPGNNQPLERAQARNDERG